MPDLWITNNVAMTPQDFRNRYQAENSQYNQTKSNHRHLLYTAYGATSTQRPALAQGAQGEHAQWE